MTTDDFKTQKFPQVLCKKILFPTKFFFLTIKVFIILPDSKKFLQKYAVKKILSYQCFFFSKTWLADPSSG